MKTRKALSLFFCTVAFAASAATVSVDTAKLAAGSWALSDASLGVPHGRTVSEATAYDVDGTPGFYAVALEGGGTVFLSADDEMLPVIAFTSSSEPDLKDGSPLRKLLEKDIAARRGILAVSASGANSKLTTSAGASSASAASASSAKAKALWSALVPPSSAPSNPKLTMASASPREVTAISDLRVDQLVQSQWSQTEAGGEPCYNYYTPDGDPCGCTATAASQIMRYFNYPDHELPSFARTCTVNKAKRELPSIGESRVYDWANMKLLPKSGATETEREAIGRLAYDVGVALHSGYTSGGTGADPQELGHLYQDDYDYASGVMYWNEAGWDSGVGGLHTREIRDKVIYANLDAKRPVQLGIYGWDSYGEWAGHSVVCDGYGFVTIDNVETEFAHINMGWHGTDDMWYNIPEINAANSGAYVGQSGIDFLYLGGAQFNIHPTEKGDLLTGRITDDDEPVAGVKVTVYASGSSVPLANTTTDVHGIYSFVLPGDATYDVKAVSADGKKGGSKDGIYLQATVEGTVQGVGNDGISILEFTHSVVDESLVGNSWGNDIDIVVPHVRIVGDRDYQNLNDALAVASEMTDPIIEIFGPIRLKEPVTITTNATIRIVPGPSTDYPDPTFDDCAISIDADAVAADGWAIQVADGVRVAFSNVVFTVESGELPYINVLATGSLSVAGKIGIGTVKVQDVDGFVIAGAFERVGSGLAVSYAGATDRYSQFGTYECSKDDASSCAGFIVDALDLTLMGSVGTNPGALVWDRVPVDPSIAIACATNDVIGTTYYLSLDLLFKDYAGGAEVVILKDCDAGAFTVPVTISNSFTIASTGVTFAVTAATDVGFSVTNGAELVFTNVVFARSGSGTRNFVTLNDGAFVLDDGAAIRGLSLAGTASAIYVNKGSVTMCDGSAITNCKGTTKHSGRGSAIYLKGADCSMDFQGGTITGCLAGYSTGAAVYAGTDAKIDVSGSASAYGNFAGGYDPKTNDVYFAQASMFTLVGPLTGNVGVICGTTAGSAFATIGDGVSQDAAKMACGHFFNNKYSALIAAVSDDGKTFVWAEQSTDPKPVPEAEAVARLVLGDASDTYASIDDALKMAGGADARIELLKDTSLVKSLSIKGSVTIDGMGKILTRNGNFYLAVTNSTLTLTNLVMNGGMGKGRVLDVRDGSLVLEADTVISGVTGTDKSMVAPVVVWGGSFVMNPGVRISDCVNKYVRMPSDGLTAGAILINGANAEFRGGTVTGCQASGAGGVYIGNGAQVRIGGDTRILGNELLTGGECNLVVQDKSGLVLADILTGRVGYTEGVSANTNVFGIVDTDFAASTTASNLVVSARRFRNDKTAAKGMVATNKTEAIEAILVWSTAVGDSTEFTNSVDGVTTVYDIVLVAVDDDDPEIVVCAPFAFAAIEEVSPGKWKLTLKPGTEHCVYTLKYSSDLKTWDTVGSPKELSSGDISGAELEFVFEVDDSTGKKFWKVEGANGIK